MTGWWLLLALAWGQEAPDEAPPDEASPDQRDESGIYEITVYGEQAIRTAREAVISEMEGMGWRAKTRKDGEIVFRPPRSWMGKAHFEREGLFWFGRPVLAVRTAELPHANDPYEPFSELEGNAAHTGVGPQLSFYVLPSMRKLAPVHREVLGEVDDDLRLYRGTLQETAFQERLAELPAQLDALWTAGTPLFGDEPVEGWAERRAQVLDLWATRAEGRQGDLVSESVEVWLSHVVQPSEHPLTAEEIAAAEARRTDGRRLLGDPDPGAIAPEVNDATDDPEPP